MNYKISIVVPVYNIEKEIVECVNSIMKSTVLPYELILVDDGSKDSSGVVCDTLAKNNPTIKVIHKENSGPSDARNTGLFAALGDYVLFVDGDDRIEQYWLESYISLLSEYGKCENNVDYIHWRQVFSFPDGTIEDKNIYIKNKDVVGKTGKQVFVEHTSNEECIWLGIRGLFRREFLIENNLCLVPELYYGEDEEFMMRVFFSAKTMLSNEYPGYIYRANRPGSLMNTVNLNKANQQLKVYKMWDSWLKGEAEQEDEAFFEALQFELNRRVWSLYFFHSFGEVLEKCDRKKWRLLLGENKEIFERAAGVYAQGKLRRYISLFGVKNATAMLQTMTDIKTKLQKVVKQLFARRRARI